MKFFFFKPVVYSFSITHRNKFLGRDPIFIGQASNSLFRNILLNASNVNMFAYLFMSGSKFGEKKAHRREKITIFTE